MNTLCDIDHLFGGDVAASVTGDLNAVSGSGRTQQRILRRLLTNPRVLKPDGTVLPPDYLWQPDYGAGLPRTIGEKLDVPALTALIRSQLLLEDDVAAQPEPQIAITALADGLCVDIRYTSAARESAALRFSLTR